MEREAGGASASPATRPRPRSFGVQVQMIFSALLQQTIDGTILEFPELPGVQVPVVDVREAVSVAEAALNARIELMLERGEVPIRPPGLQQLGDATRIAVPLRPDHAVALQMRWLRQEQGLTLTQVARRMGVSRQRISALETTARNWTVGTLVRLSEALDGELEIVLRRRRR